MELVWNKKKRTCTAPFEENGSLCSWEGEGEYAFEIRDVSQPFEAELTLKMSSRGRSSVIFWFEDNNGALFPMFLKDFYSLVKNGNVNGAPTIKGKWEVAKSGSNYGIFLVEKYDK